MSAVRLPLLCAFAGGCLSNALLFGVWRAAEGASGPSVTQPQPPARGVALVPAAAVAPSVEQPTDLGASKPSAQAQDAANESALTQPTQAVTGAGSAPVGSSVSDVLTRLEEAYRQRLGARAQPGQDPANAPPVAEVRTPTEPARGVSAEPPAQVIPVVSNATPAAAVTPAAVTPAAALTPAAVTPAAVTPAVEPQFAALPAVAAQDASRPSETHYGDVNQNTYITNIRQGDVYQIQLQQLVMLQYLQQLAVPSGLAAPGRHVGGAGHPRSVPFSSGITNPDNPWGFRFAPPNLVR